MEKRRSSYNYVRKKNKNRKISTKELILNLFLRQLIISTFLFIIIAVLKIIPLNTTITFMKNINRTVYYTMSWNEALESIKSTVIQIPIVKNWIEHDTIENKIDEKDNAVNKTNKIEDISTVNNEIIQNDTRIDKDAIDESTMDNGEDIFIIEPEELGESEEEIIP